MGSELKLRITNVNYLINIFPSASNLPIHGFTFIYSNLIGYIEQSEKINKSKGL